jgi:16S rRNA (adenine1518-N6/adenine1519-N6)-dimethyltransferase
MNSSVKIYPKKRLGQNYLIDENISRKIVEAIELSKSSLILEIGAGKGALSKYIIQMTENYYAVEIDKNNADFLSKNINGIKLIISDFLKIDIKEFYKTNGSIKIIAAGNIPYNITTPIIFKLLDNREFIDRAILMIQEEVAQRITAKPNSKAYGIISVILQVLSIPKLLFKVTPNCFYPKPKVDSRIISFKFDNPLSRQVTDIEFFKKFVKKSFSTRRKTLRNALSGLISKDELSTIDFDFSRRAESLSINEFILLSNHFNNYREK